MLPKISIDRTTMILKDNGYFTDYLQKNEYVDLDKYAKKSYGFTHAFRGQQGEFIEVDNDNSVRIDFNPNKANREQIDLMLSHLKYPHATRNDIAIDYYLDDFQNIKWSSMRPRKRNYWEDSYGNVETLYIGSPSSDKRFRIYNKSVQQKDRSKWGDSWEDSEADTIHPNHWRVEVQQRYRGDQGYKGIDYLPDDLFDIRPYTNNIDLSFIDSPNDRIMVTGLLAIPEQLSELSKNTKTKYKKLLDEARSRSELILFNPPHEVYKANKNHLALQLDDLFSKSAKLTAFKEVI